MNRMGVFLVCGFSIMFFCFFYKDMHSWKTRRRKEKYTTKEEKRNTPLRNLGVIFNCDSMSISKTVVWYPTGITDWVPFQDNLDMWISDGPLYVIASMIFVIQVKLWCRGKRIMRLLEARCYKAFITSAIKRQAMTSCVMVY